MGPWRKKGWQKKERVSILGMETTGRRGLLRTFWASSLAEILAQYYGVWRRSKQGKFPGNQGQGRGHSTELEKENAQGIRDRQTGVKLPWDEKYLPFTGSHRVPLTEPEGADSSRLCVSGGPDAAPESVGISSWLSR